MMIGENVRAVLRWSQTSEQLWTIEMRRRRRGYTHKADNPVKVMRLVDECVLMTLPDREASTTVAAAATRLGIL